MRLHRHPSPQPFPSNLREPHASIHLRHMQASIEKACPTPPPLPPSVAPVSAARSLPARSTRVSLAERLSSGEASGEEVTVSVKRQWEREEEALRRCDDMTCAPNKRMRARGGERGQPEAGFRCARSMRSSCGQVGTGCRALNVRGLDWLPAAP